jgi:hypothetical protein
MTGKAASTPPGTPIMVGTTYSSVVDTATKPSLAKQGGASQGGCGYPNAAIGCGFTPAANGTYSAALASQGGASGQAYTLTVKQS